MDDSIKISKESTIHHNMISADRTVQFDFMTSLQNIAMAKIASILWMNVETLKEITVTFPTVDCYIEQEEEEWKCIENNIVAKISHLHLPNILFQKMKDVVKDVGASVIRWVRYHNEYILCLFHWDSDYSEEDSDYSEENSEYSAVNLMKNIVWTCRGKIDYEQTARHIFSSQNTFFDDETKYKLACNYCLKDEIELLAPNIKKKFNCTGFDSEPMEYFWTTFFTKDISKFNWNNNNNWNFNNRRNRRHDCTSFNEYIMQQLIGDFRKIDKRTWNDVPIRFMWHRLSEEEKERNIIPLVKSAVESKDYLFSLLNSLCYDSQQKVFKECPTLVLECILDDWLWGEYFIPATFIVLKSLEFDKPLEYWSVLTDILYEQCNSKDMEKHIHEEYKSVFKRLWLETSFECKDSIIQFNGMGSIECFLAIILSWERDMDIAEAILKDLTAVQKKNIAFGEYSVECCIKFIKNDRWDLLELFFKHTLSTQDDISFLKKKVVEDGEEVFKYHFSKFESFDKVEHFLKWAFVTEDEREKYKQTLRKKRKHLHNFSETFPH